MSVTVIVGEQRGDEGKGRFVDMLAQHHHIVARFNGGNNAGHTVVLPDERVLKLHLVPSGIAHKNTTNIIGNGTLINPIKLVEEIETIKKQGIEVSPSNLLISSCAHIILPQHISADEIREVGEGGQGSTKSGIAQVASDKFLRIGIRMEIVHDNPEKVSKCIKNALLDQQKLRLELKLDQINIDHVVDSYQTALKFLKPFVSDTTKFIYDAKNTNSDIKILAEGAQAFLLDVDHGMYPYTTSSTTTSGGVATGLGIPPNQISEVIGVIKAVQSHVGGGEFITEINDENELKKLHGDMTTVDAECGTTTGRVRRLGHLDLPIIKRAQMINGTNYIAITKLDWLPRYGKKIKVCTAYEINGQLHDIAPANYNDAKPVYEEIDSWSSDISEIRNFDELPKEAKNYIKFLENKTGVPIKYIGVGPNREQVIVRENT